MPINSLPERTDESLAFASEQRGLEPVALRRKNWPPRVVAEVFNLVTIGDGLVGGSATIRYGIINQGVQEFRIARAGALEEPRVHRRQHPPQGAANQSSGPSRSRTRPGAATRWCSLTITSSTPKAPTLDLAGAHAVDVERETGSLGIMTAASLKLTPAAARRTVAPRG